MKMCLVGFQLKVNFKSCFGAIGVKDGVIKRYADVLNCRVLSLLFVYLGLPIGANPRRKKTWLLVIQKFSKRLAI